MESEEVQAQPETVRSSAEGPQEQAETSPEEQPTPMAGLAALLESKWG